MYDLNIKEWNKLLKSNNLKKIKLALKDKLSIIEIKADDIIL